MKSTRVFELAKELGVTSKEILEHLKKVGLPAKQAISTVNPQQVDAVLEHYTKSPAVSPGKPEPSSEKAEVSSGKPAVPSGEPQPSSEKAAAPKETAAAEKPAPMETAPAQETPPPAAPSQEPTPPKQTPPAAKRREFVFSGPVTLAELTKTMDLRSADIIKSLLQERMMVTLNQRMGLEVVRKIGELFEFDVIEKSAETSPAAARDAAAPADLKPRSPVVTIMGHVDHGKTSLLDAIRQTDVASGEAGAITQHIGAYKVSLPGRGEVVFLDTPGHEAFTSLRARGAKVTDIVVLVVAADDGVMPQTVEAIDHARAAGVPIVVAINKMDKPDANPQRVMQELSGHDLAPEAWGGKTITVEVSARDKTGLDKLLEMLLLEAEMLELKANPSGAVEGIVLEAQMHKTRGPVATVLMTQGTLKTGDIVTCGSAYGRVRRMIGSHGETLREATPATPIEMLGLSQVTEPGARLTTVKEEREARTAAERYLEIEKEKRLHQRHMTLQDLSQSVKTGSVKELRLILKADVQGSLEALGAQVGRLSNEQVKLQLIHQGIGVINSSDVALAAASDAVTLGFHVGIEAQAEQLARREEVEIKLYNVIYEAVEELKEAMEGMLAPKVEEALLGRLEVRQTFRTPRGTVAGCFVTSGKAVRGEKVRIARQGQTLFEGTLNSLRRFKEDAREVAAGYECGISLENFQDYQVGDVIEVYTQNLVQEKLRI